MENAGKNIVFQKEKQLDCLLRKIEPLCEKQTTEMCETEIEAIDKHTVVQRKAEPANRINGILKIGAEAFEIPIAVIKGQYPGKTMLITAGIHAGEYVGIQAAVELAGELDPGKVHGTIIIVKVVYKELFEKRLGSISPEDGKNLNREFPGEEDGTVTSRLAAGIVNELQSVADYCIDLHSGDDFEQLTPYVYYAGVAADDVVTCSRNMAKQVDVPYMVRSTVGTGGAYNYAASCGVPSILLERGQMGSWSMEEVESDKRDVINILNYLGIYDNLSSYRHYYPLDVTDIQYQAASCNGMWYPSKKPGDLITAGEILGVVRDYEGKILETSVAECDGVILYQTGSLQVMESGPMIAYGRIAPGKDERKDLITSYWTKRSESFLEQRREELHSAISERWLHEILPRLPKREHLRILDVGCGTGFFTILLQKQGHEVTGIDLTPDMILHGRELAQEEQADCKLEVMDAENLEFEDESFDVVISRNLTWTLPNVGHAYREWYRVLKKGGVLINFDANYGKSDFTDTTGLPEEHAHNQLGNEMMKECENIKRQLPISSYIRPAWDLETLGRIGVESFTIDLGVSRYIYQEEDIFYNPTPLFLICGKKA